ncbi:MAG TPA: nuclear transport factor 2 family protein [Candidatus Dormibacteraeota bacterium]|nr:nuclear transport factor 2 family protein [Candidatus Dormibacteraeota bacterium]
MGKALRSTLILYLLAAPLIPLHGQQKSDADAVQELEYKLMDAYKQRHVEVFASLLDDDFVSTFEDGSTYSKTGYLSFSVTSLSRVDEVGMSDLKIHQHGNTVVVIGWYHERGVNKGEKYDYHDRFTDVWMKKGTKWLLVASHYAVPVK